SNVTIGLDVFFVETFFTFFGQLFRACHQRLFGFDEFLAAEAEIARVSAGVHADRVARASLDAKAAVNAAQGVDLVADRKLLDRPVGILAGLDVDAFRGTRGGAEKTGRALHTAVVLQRQAMAPAESVGIGRALLGILHGNRSLEIAGETEPMQNMDGEIAPEAITGHAQPADNFREIEPFPERHFFDSFHEFLVLKKVRSVPPNLNPTASTNPAAAH